MPPFETLTHTQLGVDVEEEVTIKSSITAENDDDDDDEDNGDDEINTPTQTHTRYSKPIFHQHCDVWK